jgi:2',3'-cyclic-nucleotide 2'-phosphodiesterase (5'-nucleotidase family)
MIALGLSVFGGIKDGYAEKKRLVIFHTSDIHGYIKPHTARWDTHKPKRMIGGFASLATLLAKETDPYMLLDSGDFFQGAPEGTLSRGRSVVALMNTLKYDASVIGNHEYDFGEKQLIELQKQAQFPLLAANIQYKDGGALAIYAQPWGLFERNGIKVGVIGLATRFTSTSTLPAHVAHLHFVHEVDAARPHVKALRAAGADLVIALTHCGLGPSVSRKRVQSSEYVPTADDLAYPGDRVIAQKAGVDLVLGGHAHAAFSELWTPKGGAPIAQSGEHLEHATRIVVEWPKTTSSASSVSKTHSKPKIKGTLIPLWLDTYPPNPLIKKQVSELTADLDHLMNVKIGHTTAPLPRFAPLPNLDGPLPNLFCDEMAKVAQTDLALHNTFGLRNDLEAGSVTVGDLYKIMPFENTLAVMTLTGQMIFDLIHQNYKGKVSRLQVSSHLRIHFTESASPSKAGSHSTTISLNGQPLDLKKTYTVAMNSYMAGGGSCCKALKSLSHKDTGISLRALFIDTIKQKTPVSPTAVGRIQLN